MLQPPIMDLINAINNYWKSSWLLGQADIDWLVVDSCTEEKRQGSTRRSRQVNKKKVNTC